MNKGLSIILMVLLSAVIISFLTDFSSMIPGILLMGYAVLIIVGYVVNLKK